MPSPAVLEFDELLQPVPGDLPAGPPPAFTLKQQLEDARKEESPDDYDVGDPRRPEQAKKADWAAIARLTKATIRDTSKDLMLAARLTEALVKLNGYAGLRDGLRLLYHMVDECWDRINPTIEDGDLEVRATPFNWLDDPDRGARFPTSVRMVPFIAGNERPYSIFDWRNLQEGKSSINKEDFDRGVANLTREACQLLADDLDECRKELERLTAKLNELLGNYAPGFASLRPSIEDCAGFVTMILVKRTPAAAADEPSEGNPEAVAAGETGTTTSNRPKTVTRDSLYQQLQAVAAQLQNLEPHSPIPYLIQKAVELGGMPFPLLMKALIRDSSVLTEMNRELGIREQTNT